MGKEILSVALSFVPVLGLGKDVIEAITGQDLITGAELSGFARSAAIASIARVVQSSIFLNWEACFLRLKEQGVLKTLLRMLRT